LPYRRSGPIGDGLHLGSIPGISNMTAIKPVAGKIIDMLMTAHQRKDVFPEDRP
jgi:hypothetical protein